MRVSYDRIPDHRHRYIHYIGGGFLLGASGGTVYNLIRGLRSGGGLAGGACAVRSNAPRVAGRFGGYCAIFFALETAISRARRRDDGWSSIAAGAASLAVLNARRGAPVSAGAAVLGAAAVVVPMGIGWFLREWYHRLLMFHDHAYVVLDVSELVAGSTTPEVSTGCPIEQVKKRVTDIMHVETLPTLLYIRHWYSTPSSDRFARIKASDQQQQERDDTNITGSRGASRR